jgi:CheY-like chemotaxis protein
MDDATLARIFEPFFSTKFTGRGLGLAAVLGIIRGHKGTLRVTSRVGSGTTFRAYFPVTDEPEQPVPTVEAEEGYRGEGTILVVDDEPAVREVTAELVRSLGFDAVEAVDGRDALNKAGRAAGPFRLVLLDLTMPQLDGIETLAGLRQTSPAVPVILMSGYSEHELTRRYGDSGLAGFLQKPFTLDELLRSLRRALS